MECRFVSAGEGPDVLEEFGDLLRRAWKLLPREFFGPAQPQHRRLCVPQVFINLGKGMTDFMPANQVLRVECVPYFLERGQVILFCGLLRDLNEMGVSWKEVRGDLESCSVCVSGAFKVAQELQRSGKVEMIQGVAGRSLRGLAMKFDRLFVPVQPAQSCSNRSQAKTVGRI